MNLFFKESFAWQPQVSREIVDEIHSDFQVNLQEISY